MTQSIIVQVGQCGNQVGCQFWNLVLREHSQITKSGGIYNEALGSFFRNVDIKHDKDIVFGEKIQHLKARAVLVDMEEGVVNELLKGPLRHIFDCKQLITDVSGSGNNWAVGFYSYGEQYKERILDALRKAAEHCDCLQCFFILHSMGGGTGSGIGTYITQLIKDEFPDVYRFVTAVYPSENDDVITSPYNTILATNRLNEDADCVIPIENQALIDIINKIEHDAGPEGAGKRCIFTTRKSKVIKPETAVSENYGGIIKEGAPFDQMNNIVANLLLNLTSSARFDGSLNVDLNEITTNLVPFPRMHYLISSLSPLYVLADVNIPPRRIDQMFTDAFSPQNQLIKADPKHSLYFGCALMLRGNVQISDVRRNIDRLKPYLKFASWSPDGWKIGLCSEAPFGHPHSLLTLANNTCVRNTFTTAINRFQKLYKRKAHLHHFVNVDGMEIDEFDQSLASLLSLTEDYYALEQQANTKCVAPARLQVV